MLPTDRVQLQVLYKKANDKVRHRKNVFQKKFDGASDKKSILTVEKKWVLRNFTK